MAGTTYRILVAAFDIGVTNASQFVPLHTSSIARYSFKRDFRVVVEFAAAEQLVVNHSLFSIDPS